MMKANNKIKELIMTLRVIVVKMQRSKETRVLHQTLTI